VLQGDLFFSLGVCHSVHEASRASDGKETSMVSPCGRSLKKLFTTPQGSFHGILLSLGQCCMMLFHALPFCFRTEVMKPAFITRNDML
jgi:hypothetical protein